MSALFYTLFGCCLGKQTDEANKQEREPLLNGTGTASGLPLPPTLPPGFVHQIGPDSGDSTFSSDDSRAALKARMSDIVDKVSHSMRAPQNAYGSIGGPPSLSQTPYGSHHHGYSHSQLAVVAQQGQRPKSRPASNSTQEGSISRKNRRPLSPQQERRSQPQPQPQPRQVEEQSQTAAVSNLTPRVKNSLSGSSASPSTPAPIPPSQSDVRRGRRLSGGKEVVLTPSSPTGIAGVGSIATVQPNAQESSRSRSRAAHTSRSRSHTDSRSYSRSKNKPRDSGGFQIPEDAEPLILEYD